MSTPKAQFNTSSSSASTDSKPAVSSETIQLTSSPSHWTQTSHVTKAPHPLVSSFRAKVALCTQSDSPNEVVDGIAAAEAWFDREISTLAERTSLQRQARDVLSAFPLTDTQRTEIEATRSVFDDEYLRDLRKLSEMKEQLHSVPHYTAEVIDRMKNTSSASEAAQTIIDAERVLSGLEMYNVSPSTARSRLFAALRSTDGVLSAENEATIQTWFNKHKQDRWRMGLHTEDVHWIDR